MYRTPSFVRLRSGELVAFTQCRLETRADVSPMELRMKRSVDHGRSWGPAATLPFAVHDEQRPRLHRAQTLHDPRSDAIYLFDDPNELPNVAPAVCEVFIWKSTDGGTTWRLLEHTSTMANASGSGLGSGIVLPSGRLLVGQRNGCNAHEAFGAHALWSDDGGDTWQAGQPTLSTPGVPPANENQIALLSNGSLLMMARAQGGRWGMAASTYNRVSLLSRDGGRTWSAPRVESALAGFATCEGSLLSHRGRLVFSHPEGPLGARSHLTIRTSRDDGETWGGGEHDALLVHSGYSAYSSLGETARGELAVLFEADNGDLLFATTTYFDDRGGSR